MVVGIVATSVAHAHLGNLSYADFEARGSDVFLKFRYAAHATPGYPADQQQRVSRAQILGLEGGISAWLDRTVDVVSNGARCTPSLDNIVGPDSNDDLTLFALWRCPAAEVPGFRVNFRALSATMDDWKTIATASVGGKTYSTVFEPALTLWLVADAGLPVGVPKASQATGGSSFRRFFVLGVEHIWTGYDHLLFLLAVLLAGGGLGRLAAIVTSFTVAHSITLGAAATGMVHLPIAPVEALIALSIVYVALENIFDLGADRRALITFAFGLVHGFGFASVLSETALPVGEVLMPLLAFNLGVEGGQLAVVAAVLPVLSLLMREPRRRAIQVGLSVVVALAGAYWAAERISGMLGA